MKAVYALWELPNKCCCNIQCRKTKVQGAKEGISIFNIHWSFDFDVAYCKL